ncbi:unnamed protein product [Heligmosomoides polygyrus]|uniref:HTH_Tnp_Tc3_2 domain-containing protein n=1 Tax=Heligmosomoides polygyrus TaxID=6339 RepID=A0A183G1I7_HELPZ|nr:unnamed protein product [Heligmosomoides polygyrus]
MDIMETSLRRIFRKLGLKAYKKTRVHPPGPSNRKKFQLTEQDWCKGNFPQFISFHEWPANSTDLNPMDYMVWPALEAKACENLTAPWML